MTVVTAADVERATSPLVIGPGDIVTPLARDRAKELDVVIELRDGSRTPAAPEAPERRPVRLEPPPASTLLEPASGALYRRGAPLPGAVGGPGPILRAGRRAAGRAAVVGAGHVGAMTAVRLAETDLFERITLIDVVPGLAAGLALDIWHGSALGGFSTRIVGTDDFDGLTDADYVVVTAGRPRQPGMTRTDLTAVNAEIVSSVADAIRVRAPDARVVVVTNPLEEMTHLTQQRTGFPPARVVGMAGVLDSARFCSLVGLTGRAAPSDVKAFAFGSHGPEMVIPLSQAFVGTTEIEQLFDADTLRAIVERTRDSGAEVVALLQTGSAYFAPAESAARMVRAMAIESDEVMTACVQSQGAYGLADTRVGLPVRLGRSGVREIVHLTLRDDELEALRQAAERIAVRIGELS